ncbi:unnamed protein product [Amoebophrya sp. A120]|nr:unnamed protein product [Amoebophrya sp. A120]|eukprot:GSA120T00013724001.1
MPARSRSAGQPFGQDDRSGAALAPACGWSDSSFGAMGAARRPGPIGCSPAGLPAGPAGAAMKSAAPQTRSGPGEQAWPDGAGAGTDEMKREAGERPGNIRTKKGDESHAATVLAAPRVSAMGRAACSGRPLATARPAARDVCSGRRPGRRLPFALRHTWPAEGRPARSLPGRLTS